MCLKLGPEIIEFRNKFGTKIMNLTHPHLSDWKFDHTPDKLVRYSRHLGASPSYNRAISRDGLASVKLGWDHKYRSASEASESIRRSDARRQYFKLHWPSFSRFAPACIKRRCSCWSATSWQRHHPATLFFPGTCWDSFRESKLEAKEMLST